jgi:glycosyltransferase involved in cell wall biosynthesis
VSATGVAQAPRILVVSHCFDPEPFRINQVVADLIAAGGELTVLTGQPNYPEGDVYPGYRAGGSGIERHPGGYDIARVPIVPRGNGSAVRLILNYLSFIASGILVGSWLLRRRGFDTIFVYATSPAIQGYVGLWFGLIKRAAVVQWIQDLWPEALSATGFVRSRWLLAPVRAAVVLMYRASHLVLGQSHAFVRHLTPQAGRTPVAYFPNPGEHAAPSHGAPAVPELGPGFHIVFGGNLGKAQALPTVIAAAALLRDDPDVRFTLFGSGAMVEWMLAEITRLNLSNVTLGGRMPPAAMPGIYAQASVLLLTLVDDPLLAQTVPSKLQSYLATGVPIVVAVNGEAADIVRHSGGGIACAADDPEALADAIRTLKAMPASDRAAMGAAGCRFFTDNYNPTRLSRQLLALLATPPRTAAPGGMIR